MIDKAASIFGLRAIGCRPQKSGFLLIGRVPADRANAPVRQVRFSFPGFARQSELPGWAAN